MKHASVLIGLLVCLACGSGSKEESPKEGENDAVVPQFSLVPASIHGIDFENKLPENRLMNILAYQYYYNGGGVSVGDINNDSLPDLFLTANYMPNRLYLNQGNLKFKDITESAGIRRATASSWCTGTSMVDINADGLLDIYVCRSGNLQPQNRTNLLYVNMGDNTFIESAAVYGLDDTGFSIQAAFIDYDKDGDLDMYLANHGMSYYGRDASRSQQASNYDMEDRFYRNDNGYFTNVTEEVGIYRRNYGYGLGVVAGDVNDDGWDDIYVSNDFYEHDYLYLNTGRGTFKESIKSQTDHISFFGMGADMADYNNDGLLDIAVVDMAAQDHERRLTNLEGISYEKHLEFLDRGFFYQYMFNSLQLNRGKGKFSNVQFLANVGSTDWSWAPLFADYDNDGFKDLLITNGLRKDVLNLDYINSVSTRYNKPVDELNDEQFQELMSAMPSEKLQNYMFRNRGDLTFENKARDWGMLHTAFSNGAAYADLDKDGDLDLVINNIDEPLFLYRNNGDRIENQNYLRIQLQGSENNPLGLGAKVTIITDSARQYQQMYLTRGYQSSVEPVLHFGVGEADQVEIVKVVWPDGKVSEMSGVGVNRVVSVAYAGAGAEKEKEDGNQPLFTDITRQAGISHRHRENEYNDFKYQVLLPHKMSQEGPGVAVADVNGDGLDDFFIGGAIGYAGKLYIQNTNGTFRAGNAPWAADRDSEDVGATFFDANGDRHPDLYVVSGGYEYSSENPALQDRLYLNDGKGNFSKDPDALPQFLVSGGCAVPADFDRDGDFDLFVGGRQVPDQYPLPARSALLRNDGGQFMDVTADLAPQLQNLGMVTTAQWSDVDGDDLPDLIIAGEWMPITIFKNSPKGFNNASLDALPAKTHGWYYNLLVADLDQDGDQDLIAGNLGLNHRYQASEDGPLEIYADDFDNNGDLDPVLAYHYDNRLFPFEGRNKLFGQMTMIKREYTDYQSFAEATMQQIFGLQALDSAYQVKAYEFASNLYYNDGTGNFKNVAPLPKLAQVAPIKSMIYEDLNGDGSGDLLVAGNHYETEHQIPRIDAGKGLFMSGNGKQFEVIPNREAGLMLEGSVKFIHLIRMSGGERGVLVVRNDDEVSLLKINSPTQVAGL